ncbi:hypothetical protein [Tritonibacter horizontis]|uniref:Permease n=1 Tax=Tritonibacter horizontis TaxID=1768241 RepID=A0A132C3G4_9RHOB|nr:hypothetical protein [Tritonibacter horizontis]KUP95066.1 hypothetical protein TRIHO_00240 [Tritonibacter horizontis]
MNILIGTVLITVAAIWLWCKLPNDDWRRASYRASYDTLLFTAPRILVALLGAGFFAELLPADQVRQVLGAEAGVSAVLLAIALGPITPGGAFVSFAIAAAALKAGAAPVAAVAYVTSWSLFSMTKIFAYELSFMGRSATLSRILVSLPVPFAVAALAALLL